MTRKAEPFLAHEKSVNEDGTPSDYLVRYLQSMADAGQKEVKFPVTSVNGKVGDVVIDLGDVLSEGGIDYDKLNDKIQELINGLVTLRSEMINLMDSHVEDYHKYNYQGFMQRNFGDERMFNNTMSRDICFISTITKSLTTVTVTTTVPHQLSLNDDIYFEALAKNNDAFDLDGTYKVSNVVSGTQFQIEVPTILTIPSPLGDDRRLVKVASSGFAPCMYVPCLQQGAPVNNASPWTDDGASPKYNIDSTKNKMFSTFGMIIVERTMNVSRLYIPYNMPYSANSTSNSRYSIKQFALFDSTIVQCVNKTSYYIDDVAVRMPNNVLWKSPRLDSRVALNVIDDPSIGVAWGNVNQQKDILAKYPSAVTMVNNGSTATISRVYSENVGLVLKRGIYFFCLSQMICQDFVALPSDITQRIGDIVIPYSTSTGAGFASVDGNYGASLYQHFMESATVDITTFSGAQFRDGSFSSLNTAGNSKYISFYDKNPRAFGDFEDVGSINFGGFFVQKNIKPAFGGMTVPSLTYYDNDLADERLLRIFPAPQHFPYVGLAGVFTDKKPSDAW